MSLWNTAHHVLYICTAPRSHSTKVESGFFERLSTISSSSLRSSKRNSNNQPQQFGMTETFDNDYINRLTKWIVIVDDEESIRNAVGEFLSSQGYRVTACEDADSAYHVCTTTTRVPGKKLSINSETLARSGGGGIVLPDAIVSDIRMPGKRDGIDFLKQIRRDPMLEGIPVILLTAKGLTQDRIKGYDAGADAYLPKPFSPDELVSILDNVIERYETLNGQQVKMETLEQDVKRIKKMIIEDSKKKKLVASSAASSQIPTPVVPHSEVQGANEVVFLTTDELFVLKLLASGLTNKEIAGQMGLSQRRIEQHLTSMFQKANVVNRTELLRWAIVEGLVDI